MLFKDNSDFQDDFKLIDKNMSFKNMEQHISNAEEQYIVKVLGAAQLAEVQDAYTADPSPAISAPLAALLTKCQNAIRELALYIGLPKLNLRISDLGVMKSDSQDYVSSSGGEMYFARLQYLIDGYKALDALYKFLEENKADYPLWTGATVYTQYKSLLVNTTELFSSFVNAVDNRWLFSKLIPQQKNVERMRVRPALGAEFFDDLKSGFADGSLSSDEEELLVDIQNAIALYTYADALTDPTVRELIRVMNATTADELSNKGTLSTDYAKQYEALAELKRDEAGALINAVIKKLNETATDVLFPLFYSSDLYVGPATSTTSNIQHYDNDNSESSFAFL